MPCRVGISTQPQQRRQTWENEVVGLKNWRIIQWHQTFEAAQNHETRLASQKGCKAAPGGGAGVKGPWAVYYFEYTRTKG